MRIEPLLDLAADGPDVVILAATAFAAHRVLRGPVLADVLEPVSPDLLRSAVLGGAGGV